MSERRQIKFVWLVVKNLHSMRNDCKTRRRGESVQQHIVNSVELLSLDNVERNQALQSI